MSLKKRQTLRNYFSAGALPLQQHFHDLIDSTLNMVDDGFSKSPESGFTVAALGTHDGLLSFSRDSNPRDTIWSVSFADGGNDLSFRAAAASAPVVTLAAGTPQDAADADRTDGGGDLQPIVTGRVGINMGTPSCALDVGGVIRAEGRSGANPHGIRTVPADGGWHDVTTALDGCQAFELMAGVGSPRRGRYALLRAYVQNAFNPRGWIFNFLNLKRRIRYDQAYFRSKSDKIRLRWAGGNHDYRLQLRTNCNYGENVLVRFYLTRLWFDPFMAKSARDPDKYR